jgi:hypothetical protein
LKNDNSSTLVICDIPAEFSSALNNLVNKPTWCTLFLSIFMFVNLYMFRAAMCPSSGDTAVFMRHLVPVILVDDCLVFITDSQTCREKK